MNVDSQKNTSVQWILTRLLYKLRNEHFMFKIFLLLWLAIFPKANGQKTSWFPCWCLLDFGIIKGEAWSCEIFYPLEDLCLKYIKKLFICWLKLSSEQLQVRLYIYVNMDLTRPVWMWCELAGVMTVDAAWLRSGFSAHQRNQHFYEVNRS